MKLFLIRHAEPDYPGGERMCLGNGVDLPLSACGQKQALELRGAFSGINLTRVYSSPLLRAKHTALPLALGRVPITLIEELRELDGGEWDGLTFSEIRARYPDAVFPPPGGESDESGLNRAMRALDIIARDADGDAAAVAHSGINRLLLASVIGLPQSRRRDIAQSYACVNILEFDLGKWRVIESGITLEQWTKRAKGDEIK